MQARLHGIAAALAATVATTALATALAAAAKFAAAPTLAAAHAAALYDQRERHVGAPLRIADRLHDSYVGVPQRPRHGSRRLSRARRGHLQLLQTRFEK